MLTFNHLLQSEGMEPVSVRLVRHALDNHGGNVLLKKRSPKPYQLSILETVSSLATPDDVIRRERMWKEKLGSRAFGLNLN
jgi:hypothetical protein